MEFYYLGGVVGAESCVCTLGGYKNVSAIGSGAGMLVVFGG